MKKLTSSLTLAVVTLLLVSSIISCTSKTEEPTEAVPEVVPESTFDLTTAKTEIIAASQDFMTFFAAGDSVGLANLYTQDAKFMMTGSPSISGREIW